MGSWQRMDHSWNGNLFNRSCRGTPRGSMCACIRELARSAIAQTLHQKAYQGRYTRTRPHQMTRSGSGLAEFGSRPHTRSACARTLSAVYRILASGKQVNCGSVPAHNLHILKTRLRRVRPMLLPRCRASSTKPPGHNDVAV
jgi:hypothetical protein